MELTRKNTMPFNPSRKLRGGRRYYKRLGRRAETFSVDLTPGEWYDLWHTHFDWTGHSTRGGRVRREHLSALFVAFRRTLEQAANASMPVQIFLSIAPESHADEDALYVHTRNPNGTPFPHKFDGATWGIPAPPFLRCFVDDERWEVGTYALDGQAWWIVRPRIEAVQPAPDEIHQE